MISLRKHIEGHKDPVGEAVLQAYRSALVTIGESGEWAVPELGDELSRTLVAMSEALNKRVTPEDISEANTRLKTELSNWAGRAHKRHRENEREIREIISVVANTSATVAERGESYAREIGSLNKNLQSLANLNDISVIRRSILESARALQDCVEKMVEDGRQSAQKLAGEIAEYRTRLEESERISSSDSLTGLANRRAFEMNLETRISAGQPFCLIMMDLNGFKGVNDRYGHLAGDDLLQQFAEELKTYSPASDLLARWGGDEFVAIVSGPASEGESRLQRIHDWVLGEYKIHACDEEVPIMVSASLGLVEWDGREDGVELLARADKRVYAAKGAVRGRAA
jgi:diguanylate cyclase (GGDEF)-like protein